MFGVILASVGTLFDEFSMLIGKAKITAGKESVFTMGFLNLFWVVLAFAGIAIFVPSSFRFSEASLPFFIPRIILEIAQAAITVKAVAVATRSTFSFIRSLTIPLLLGADILLGYTLSLHQIVGIAIIVITLMLLFANHKTEQKGSGYVLFTAINAVATISLYKYDITHFNSVIAEQLIVMVILLIFFFLGAYFFARENPIRFLIKPIFLAQSLGTGAAAAVESFAFIFAPASIITAAKRASAVFWAILSGKLYFSEKHFLIKLFGFIMLTTGIVLLAL